MSRRYCTLWNKKIRYTTYKRAVRVALSLFDRGETETLNSAYFCRACDGYHLSSQNQMEASRG